jgi:hypothetical protein
VFTTFLAASKDEQYATKLQDLRVPYWVCISQAMLVSAIALGFKLREWFSQIQSRVRTARDDGIEQAPTRHEALLAKIGEAKKTCIAHVIAVVVAVFEARRRRRRPIGSPRSWAAPVAMRWPIGCKSTCRCGAGSADGRAHGHVRGAAVQRPRRSRALAGHQLHHARHEARPAHYAQALVHPRNLNRSSAPLPARRSVGLAASAAGGTRSPIGRPSSTTT